MNYQLLDSGDFSKLENVGGRLLIRPAPAAVWRQENPDKWRKVDAVLIRKSGGDGEWKLNNAKVKEPWTIDVLGLTLEMRLTGFGHLGIFPEQLDNWKRLEDLVGSLVRRKNQNSSNRPRIMNLFGYTGISTLVCARAGAEAVHVDASKTSVAWARRNAELSKLDKAPIRWIVEDAQDFVSREVRRGNKYDGIILDPPSFGRGQKNQLWKIEKHLIPLLDDLKKLLVEDETSFVCLSSHTPGYTPLALENLLRDMMGRQENLEIQSNEMIVTDVNGRPLPSGTTALLIVSK